MCSSQMRKQINCLQARLSCLSLQHSAPCKQEESVSASKCLESNKEVVMAEEKQHAKKQVHSVLLYYYSL